MATEGRDGMQAFYVAHILVDGAIPTHAYTGSANGISQFTNWKTQLSRRNGRNVMSLREGSGG